jgi:hypothetical protein
VVQEWADLKVDAVMVVQEWAITMVDMDLRVE